MFDLKKTDIYEAIQMEKSFGFFGLLKKIFFFLTLILAALLLAAFVFNSGYLRLAEGLTVISLSIYAISFVFYSFFESELKNPAPKADLSKVVDLSSYNLAELLNFNSAKYLNRAMEQAAANGLKYPTSALTLYFLLDEKNPKINFLFSRFSLSLSAFKKDLEGGMLKGAAENDSDNFEILLSEAAKSAIKRQGTKIKEGDLIAALAEKESLLIKTLTDLELGREDVENISWWIESTNKRIRQSRIFWDLENLKKIGSLANDWTYGYTPTLDNFSIDWSQEVSKRGYEEIIGHKAEIEMVEQILTRKGSKNALLIGEIGSGRKN
ncbi:MAG: hypothetical protein PHG23_01145, partial [Candidatus Pacebacteria bacterium]|nr:hypothetical protein [Candidatus Paceibacterota bacterium]